MIHIIKHIASVDKRLIGALEKHSTATIHEAMGKRGALSPSIKPISRGMKLCGRALTVRCHPGDNLMLIKAVSMARAGDVIVVDTGRTPNVGPFGEVLAVECMAKNLSGIVLTGSVRDSAPLIRLGFSVFSSNICISGTSKATLGTINHPIACGDEIIKPGDIIVGDDDGVVVVPCKEVKEILIKADEREAKEAEIISRLRAGESLFDIYGYQEVFDRLGCIEEDND